MRPILTCILILTVSACLGNEPDEFEQCLGSISFHDYEVPRLTESVASANESPVTFLAAKGISSMGLYYVVVANYEQQSVATFYRSGLGTKTLPLTLEEGQQLYSLVANSVGEEFVATLSPDHSIQGPILKDELNLVEKGDRN